MHTSTRKVDDEYAWYIWDKAMYFLLQISPLFSFCSALRWFFQHIFKNESSEFGFIAWIDHNHNKLKGWSNIHSPQREVFHWRYCLKTKRTGMSIISLLNGYTYMTPGVTAPSFSSNSITEKIHNQRIELSVMARFLNGKIHNLPSLDYLFTWYVCTLTALNSYLRNGCSYKYS